MALRPLMYIDKCNSGMTPGSPFQSIIFTDIAIHIPSVRKRQSRICMLVPSHGDETEGYRGQGGRKPSYIGRSAIRPDCTLSSLGWDRQIWMDPEYRRLRKSGNMCIFVITFIKKEFKMPDDAVYCSAELYVPNLKSSTKRLKCPVSWTECIVFAFKASVLIPLKDLWNFV